MPLPQARTAGVVTLLESSFSLGYGRNLPSSLTIVHPITLVFSTYPPELVWGTDTCELASGFSRQHRIGDFTCSGSASRLRVREARIFLVLLLHAYPRTTIAWAHLPSCVPALLVSTEWAASASPPLRGAWRRPLSNPASTWTRTWWYRNINRLCIGYACRPRLSLRLTLGGLASPRNPWISGGGVSHPSFATHTCIRTRPRSTPVHTDASRRDRRSATTPVHTDFRAYRRRHPPIWASVRCQQALSLVEQASAVSALCLSPVTLSAQNHLTSELLRTLSRMAASKPTSWLSEQFHIVYHLAQN